MGPIDYYTDRVIDEDIEAERDLSMDWIDRKSGSRYRGQINIASLKPDGMGFKINTNGSLYEGMFENN